MCVSVLLLGHCKGNMTPNYYTRSLDKRITVIKMITVGIQRLTGEKALRAYGRILTGVFRVECRGTRRRERLSGFESSGRV